MLARAASAGTGSAGTGSAGTGSGGDGDWGSRSGRSPYSSPQAAAEMVSDQLFAASRPPPGTTESDDKQPRFGAFSLGGAVNIASSKYFRTKRTDSNASTQSDSNASTQSDSSDNALSAGIGLDSKSQYSTPEKLSSSGRLPVVKDVLDVTEIVRPRLCHAIVAT